MNWNNRELEEILKRGDLVIMLSDTIYGIFSLAHNPVAVERVYTIRKRAPEKPCIVLISSTDDLNKFSIKISNKTRKILDQYWPGPVSIIFDCPEEKFSYLHRGTKTLAFRIPEPSGLRKLLVKTGPLIAPSANPEGLSPASNITQAKKYFSDTVDLYVDGGEIIGEPSKVIKINASGAVTTLRG